MWVRVFRQKTCDWPYAEYLRLASGNFANKNRRPTVVTVLCGHIPWRLYLGLKPFDALKPLRKPDGDLQIAEEGLLSRYVSQQVPVLSTAGKAQGRILSRLPHRAGANASLALVISLTHLQRSSFPTEIPRQLMLMSVTHFTAVC